MSSGSQVRELDLQINAPVSAAQSEILTPEALRFVARLAAEFDSRRQDLLAFRRVRQAELDAGHFPDFLVETTEIRLSEWTVAPIPRDLTDRRVEITGPVDRKLGINALNSGANVFMADFEEPTSPSRSNNVEWHINLRDATPPSLAVSGPSATHTT